MYDNIINQLTKLSETAVNIEQELSTENILIKYTPSKNNILNFELINNINSNGEVIDVEKNGIHFSLHNLKEINSDYLTDLIVYKIGKVVDDINNTTRTGN